MIEAQSLVQAFLAAPDPSELDAAVCVARLIEPAVDPEAVYTACEALSAHCQEALAGHADAEALCDYFHDQGFRGAADDYYLLDNSRIDLVLSRRQGIPISLAVLYLETARALGLEAHGINFPGHFLVRVQKWFVDPFRHRTQTEADCLRRVEQSGNHAAAVQLLRAASAQDFLVRMLNNVRSILTDAGDLPRALDIIQCQRLVRPRELGLGVEEARLWERLEVPAQARETLVALLPHVAHEHTRRQMQEWMRQLASNAGPTLH